MGSSLYKKKSNILELPDQFFSSQVFSPKRVKKTADDEESEMDETVEGEKKKEEVELQYIASIFDSSFGL